MLLYRRQQRFSQDSSALAISTNSYTLIFLFFYKFYHVEFLFVLVQPIQRKKVGEEKRMTQEEMLLEAAQTGLGIL